VSERLGSLYRSGRASSLLSSLAAQRRPSSSSKKESPGGISPYRSFIVSGAGSACLHRPFPEVRRFISRNQAKMKLASGSPSGLVGDSTAIFSNAVLAPLLAAILRPHPPKDADEVGVVISQSIMAFSRRKLVTDFQFFWCCRISTNVLRTFSGSCSRARRGHFQNSLNGLALNWL
jgi:hypothetical protein